MTSEARPCRLAPGLLAVMLVGSACARLATAQTHGISIGWQDCRSGGSAGFGLQNFGCASNTSAFPLYAGVQLAAAVDSVFSMELVIDVDVAASPLPDWWSMDGACRALSWTAGTGLPSGCADVWGGAPAAATVQGWLPGTPGGSARHARLLVAAGVLAAAAVTMNANTPYTVCRVALDSRSTTMCPAGCTTPACLVFNSLLIRRLPGSAVEEVLVTDPEVMGANVVVWQPSLGSADCASVPVRRSTWGAVKALYR